MRLRNAAYRRSPRPGVTLIEMMVVLTILIVLASLTIGALLKATDWMKRSTTEQVMQKVYTIVDRKAKTCEAEAKGWDVPQGIFALAGGNPRRAKAIQRKFLYKWSFPQSYQEAARNALESDSNDLTLYPGFAGPFGYRPGGYPMANQIYRELRKQNPSLPALPAIPAAPATLQEAAAQSAGCLTVIYNTYSSTDTLSGRELADTNGDGVVEVIDAWDMPMLFFRWPTGLTNPMLGNRLAGYTANAGALLQDLDDPEKLLYDDAWQTTTLASLGYTIGVSGTTTCADEMEARFHPIRRNNAPSQLMAPLTLISASTDRQFGIVQGPDPMVTFTAPNGNPANERARIDPTATNTPAEFDNLYSFRFRLGTRQQ